MSGRAQSGRTDRTMLLSKQLLNVWPCSATHLQAVEATQIDLICQVRHGKLRAGRSGRLVRNKSNAGT
jgi:hypothetical protein